MIKRYEFIERIIYIIRKRLEMELPEEASEEKMFQLFNKILKRKIK